MSDVLDAFASPTANLDPSVAAEVRSVVDGAVTSGMADGVPEAIYRQITKALEDTQESEAGSVAPRTITVTAPLAPRAFEAEGYGSIERICDGWDDASAPDEARNGTLKLTFTFRNLVLDPTMWGSARGCRYDLDGRRLLIDRGTSVQDLRLWIGVPTRIQDLPDASVTLAIDAKLVVDDAMVPVGLGVRFGPGLAALDLLVRIGTGTLVVSLVDRRVVRVRAHNGDFACDTETGVCTDASGASVTL